MYGSAEGNRASRSRFIEPGPRAEAMNPSRDAIRQSFLDAGLGHVTDQIMSALQPAFQLFTEPTEEVALPLGSSKMGGRRDADAEFQWPVFLGGPPVRGSDPRAAASLNRLAAPNRATRSSPSEHPPRCPALRCRTVES